MDIVKKMLHIDFATSSRVYHFRTRDLIEKHGIDTALTIIASQVHADDDDEDEEGGDESNSYYRDSSITMRPSSIKITINDSIIDPISKDNNKYNSIVVTDGSDKQKQQSGLDNSRASSSKNYNENDSTHDVEMGLLTSQTMDIANSSNSTGGSIITAATTYSSSVSESELISLTEVDNLIKTLISHHDGSRRLLHIGILDKTGSTSLLWEAWLTRLILITTKGIEYYTIPHIEHSKQGSSSKVGLEALAEVDRNKVMEDYNECSEMRTAMIKYPESGFQLVESFLRERHYTMKVNINVYIKVYINVYINVYKYIYCLKCLLIL